jgi:hypothetical protein
MLVGLPAFMLVLYGFALNFDVRHVALAVQDLDGSRGSRDLLASFVNSTYFDVTVVAEAGDDLERITRSRAAKAVLVIPAASATTSRRGGARRCSCCSTAPTPRRPRRSSATRAPSRQRRTSACSTAPWPAPGRSRPR